MRVELAGLLSALRNLQVKGAARWIAASCSRAALHVTTLAFASIHEPGLLSGGAGSSPGGSSVSRRLYFAVAVRLQPLRGVFDEAALAQRLDAGCAGWI